MDVVLRRSLVLVVVPLVAGLVPGCRDDSAAPPKPDAVTQATYKVIENPVLPPDVGEYEVIGTVEGLNNFVVRYDARLIRGGQPLSGKGMKALKKWGVTTILSVSPDDILRKYAQDHDLKLVDLAFDKAGGVPAETLATFLDAVRGGDGPFYLHCIGGTHRAGALGLAYRLHVSEWEQGKALIEFGRLGGDLKGDHAMIESVREAP